MPIKYVHQLQNLYFALTGEELKINESTSKLNLGCGNKKINGFINLDAHQHYSPDIIHDLNQFPWPFKDNEYSHIFAQNVIQYLGENKEDIIDIIKEMYRVSSNSAIWEIQAPHWRSDTALDDPTHKCIITKGLLNKFNQKLCLDNLKDNPNGSRFAFDNAIDIEVVDTNYIYNDNWKQRLSSKDITEDELQYAVNTFNNVASSSRFLIQVHKPGRIPKAELENVLNK